MWRATKTLPMRTNRLLRLVLRAITFVALTVVTSCSGSRLSQTASRPPTSQESYEYPGCGNHNADCPRMWTLACGLRTIASKYNACSKHEECVAAVFDGKCSGAGTCPPFYVNQQFKSAFEAEVQYEIDRYCESGTCSAASLCPELISVEAYCASRHCTWSTVIRAPP